MHGSLLPWDDDLDVIIRHYQAEDLIKTVKQANEDLMPLLDPDNVGFTLNVQYGRYRENLKIWVEGDDSSLPIPQGWKKKPQFHRWPFLDVFLFDEDR